MDGLKGFFPNLHSINIFCHPVKLINNLENFAEPFQENGSVKGETNREVTFSIHGEKGHFSQRP